MKHMSFQMKLILIMSAFILGIVCIMLVSNIAFLSKFYTSSKVNSLGNGYEKISQIYQNCDENGGLKEEQYVELERLSANGNMNVYVFDVSYQLDLGLFGGFGSSIVPDLKYPQYYTDQEMQEVKNCIERYLTEAGNEYLYKEKVERLKHG